MSETAGKKARYLSALRTHASVGAAARIAGIHYNTVLRWRRRDDAFRDDEQLVRDDLEVQGRMKPSRGVPPGWVLLRLREWLGVTTPRLADVFGCSESAIKKALSDAVE